MRRAVLIAMMMFSFFAATNSVQANDPWPTCNPCPLAR